MGMEQQRALLDQFFGPDRDIPPSKLQKKRKKNFFEKDICKYFLAGPCQHRIHDTQFKDQYLTLRDDVRKKYGFDEELFRKLQDLVRDMDRKIAKNRKRAGEENVAKIISKEQQIILDDL